ncbi:MAG: periplasmic heavy metal sensor [Bacteroidales bacterium]|nr:periplasmic heavy metal sensor [Bacteroidales bacterium]
MDYFNKNKILIWIVIILLAINVSTIVTIVYHFYSHDRIERTNKRRHVRIPNKRFGRFMFRELDLSQSQRRNFQNFRAGYNHNAMNITKEMMEKRKEIFEELSKENPDTTKLYEMAEDIGIYHKILKKETIRHYLKMKRICNKPQQEKLMKIYKAMQNSKVDIVSKMRR